MKQQYASDVESKLNSRVKELIENEEYQNILFGYNNFTYHIKLFTVDINTYNEHITKALNGVSIDTSNIGGRLIIAESGVTGKLNIESLKIKNLGTPNNKGVNSVVSEFTLILNEMYGMTLVDKLTMASIYGGYTNYTTMPIFISLSFYGWNEESSKSERITVPCWKNKSELVYSCIITKFEASTSLMGVTYNIQLAPIINAMSIDNKLFSVPFPEIKSDNTTIDLKTIAKDVEEKMNQYYEEKYHNDYKIITEQIPNGKPITIEVVEKVDVSNISGSYSNNSNTMALQEDTSSEEQSENTSQDGDAKNGSNNKTVYKFKSNETFNELWTDLIHLDSEHYKGKKIRIEYQTLGVKSVNGTLYSALKAIIHVEKDEILENETDFQKMVGDDGFNYQDFKSNCIKNQNVVLDSGEKYQIVRFYQDVFNGSRNGVLSAKMNLNNLWTMNIINTKNMAWQQDIKSKSEQQDNKDPDSLNNISDEKPIQTSSSSDKWTNDVFIDDMFEEVMNNLDTTNQMISITSVNVGEMNDTLQYSKTKKDENKTITKKEQEKLYSKTAYNNIFSGNGLKVNIEILGDPYWLYWTANQSKEFSFINIIYSYAGYYSYDEYDQPVVENNIKSVYYVNQVVSTFSQGKFTQEIEAIQQPHFAQITS